MCHQLPQVRGEAPETGLDSFDCMSILKRMAQTFLTFNFGSNEEAAQQARHTVERWKQGFRLDKKLLVKFDREDAGGNGAGDGDDSAPEKPKKGNSEGAKAAKAEKIILMLRLDFSDHEKLSYQRWVDRIPTEADFKDAHPRVIRSGDPDFKTIADRFEHLD